MKIYIVTYVGLSDNEAEANGYTSLYPYKNKKEARKCFDELKTNEMECCKESGFDFLVTDDEPNLFRMAWCGMSEQVIVKYEECKLL